MELARPITCGIGHRPSLVSWNSVWNCGAQQYVDDVASRIELKQRNR